MGEPREPERGLLERAASRSRRSSSPTCLFTPEHLQGTRDQA